MADELLFLIARPLTAGVGPTYDCRSRFADIEIDYAPVYSIGSPADSNMLKMLHITLTARSGDYAAAAGQTGDGTWLFADTVAEIDDAGAGNHIELIPGISISTVVSMAQILRHAGKHDRALDLLRRAGRTPEGPSFGGLWATIATLAITDLDVAADALDEAERLMPKMSATLAAMRAELYVHHGLWNDAIALLDTAEAGNVPEQRRRFETVRARAERGRGHNDTALDLAAHAIASIEEDRLDLSHWRLREAWSGAAAHPYQIAIDAAGRTATAFEFAERARSRAFLDDVGLADAEVEELTRQIRAHRNDLDWLERLPERPGPSDMTRLHALDRRHPVDRPLPHHKGLHRLDATELRRRIENVNDDLADRLDLRPHRRPTRGRGRPGPHGPRIRVRTSHQRLPGRQPWRRRGVHQGLPGGSPHPGRPGPRRPQGSPSSRISHLPGFMVDLTLLASSDSAGHGPPPEGAKTL